MSWDPRALRTLRDAQELSITTRRSDDTLRAWVPIWVVVVEQQVYVRTWHRRDTGWFGHAVRTGRAQVRAGDVECEVAVEDLGPAPRDQQELVNIAYADKYGSGGDPSVSGMVTPAAMQTTLRLAPID